MIGPDDRTHAQCPERVSRRLVASSKGIPLEKSFGEWTGLAKFSARFGEKLMETIGRLLEEGHLQDYDTLAFSNLAEEGESLHIFPFENIPWLEIDTKEDLKRARELF